MRGNRGNSTFRKMTTTAGGGRSGKRVGGLFKSVFSLSFQNHNIQPSLFLQNPQRFMRLFNSVKTCQLRYWIGISGIRMTPVWLKSSNLQPLGETCHVTSGWLPACSVITFAARKEGKLLKTKTKTKTNHKTPRGRKSGGGSPA